MLQNNSSQLQNKHLVQALRQKCLVLFQRQLSQKPLSELFAEIDRSGNGYVEIIELRKYLLKNGVDSTEEDLHEFLQIMDTDYDNKVKLNEFYDFVMEKQGVGQQPGQSQIKATQNVVNVFKYAVLDYMKKNNFGFSHIFQLLNQKKDNRLKENDIQDFCNYQLQMRLSQIDMNTVSIGPPRVATNLCTAEPPPPPHAPQRAYTRRCSPLSRRRLLVNDRNLIFCPISGG